MTVGTESSHAEFVYTGVEANFPAGFPAQDVNDIAVWHVSNASPPVITPLLNGINVNVTIDPATELVTVTAIAGQVPAVAGTIVIDRVTPGTQDTNFANLGGFSAATHQKLHDAEAMRDDEAKYRLGRAILVPTNETMPFTLPAKALRANGGAGSYAGFDGNGNPTIFLPEPPPGFSLQPVNPQPAAQTFFAGPASGPAAPAAFRAIGINDLPAAAMLPLGGAKGAILAKRSAADRDAQWFDFFFNIEEFGGAGDGVTDNTAALNAALVALAGTGGTIYFPAGKYTFTSPITFNFPAGIFSVSIVGAGQDATILTWPGAAGGLTFNYAGVSNGLHVRDLSLTTGTADGGNALTLNMASSVVNVGVAATTDIYRVTMRGDDGYRLNDYWSLGLNIMNVSQVQVHNLTVAGSATQQGIGASVVGDVAAHTFAVLLDISESNFVGLSTGLIYGSFVQGVTVDQTNFTFCTIGIAAAAGETGALVQLAVTASQFNPGAAAGGKGIDFETAVGGVQIISCYFVIGGPNQFGILLGAVSHCIIAYNQMQGNNSTSGNAIVAGAQAGGALGMISHNEIFGWGSAGLGIWLQAASANILVDGNNFVGNASNILNQGTNNIIRDNPGFNPVGPSGIAVGGSPFTYTAGASPETVYIWGGTVSQVAVDKNGGPLNTIAATETNTSFNLAPYEQIKVTYSVAPNMNKMIH